MSSITSLSSSCDNALKLGAPSLSNAARYFQISPSFHNCEIVNFSEKDIFTQMSFDELKQQQENQGLPFFLAIIQDTNGVIHTVDAISLIAQKLKYKEMSLPGSKQQVLDGMIYKLEPGSCLLDAFCSLNDIDNGSTHFIMSILAADLNLSPTTRGVYRFYLGGFYHHINHDLKNAEFWYLKSIDDRCYAAHICLAGWYESGDYYVKSTGKCVEELYKALQLCPHAEYQQIHELIRAKISRAVL
jgi:hypothetical protein